MTAEDFWSIPPLFDGKTVAIIATGLSLKQEDVDLLKKNDIPAIAVNNGYEYAPWAQILYAADLKWWQAYWEKGKLGGSGAREFPGLKVTIQAPSIDPGLKIVGNGGVEGFDKRPGYVRTGRNSAYQAAHIAATAGAARILLLGCDCKKPDTGADHCFGSHDWRNRAWKPDFEEWIRCWGVLAKDLQGCTEIINCSPGSAIECFPRAELKDVLC